MPANISKAKQFRFWLLWTRSGALPKEKSSLKSSWVGRRVSVMFRKDYTHTEYEGVITADPLKSPTCFKLADGRSVDTSEVIYRPTK